jgi:hypothetical protein
MVRASPPELEERSMTLMLADDDREIVMQLAAPLELNKRDAFLIAVEEALAGVAVPGPGVIHRAARAAQRQFFDAPEISPNAAGPRHLASRRPLSA